MDNKQQASHTDQVRHLFNSILYVLQNSYYRGEDAHLVELSKQFVKQMKDDFEQRVKAEEAAKKATEEANKPKASDAV